MIASPPGAGPGGAGARRLTGATVSALALIAIALLLGVVSGRAELFVAGVPLALRLLAGARRRPPSAWTLTHAVSSARLFEGERLTVTTTLTSPARVLQVEALEPLPASARLVSGANRVVVSVGAGETVTWSYDIEFPERARVALGTVHLRDWSPTGLAVDESVRLEPAMVRVYPQATPLRRLPAPRRTQTSVGNYVSPLVGDGLEPGDVRLFAPGDRVRHVNWRASQRLGRLYVTRYQQERNADVVLMLDSLVDAGGGATSALSEGLRAVSSLAAAYLARKDRVGLIEYGGVLRWVRPGSGRPHFERLLDTLLRADVTFTYVAKDLGLIPARVLPPQALVIAITPLLDGRFVTAIADLAGRGFDLIVLAVDAVAATRASVRPTPLLDTVCRLWRLERERQIADLSARGLDVVDWRGGEPLELALSRAGRRRRQRAVAG